MAPRKGPSGMPSRKSAIPKPGGPRVSRLPSVGSKKPANPTARVPKPGGPKPMPKPATGKGQTNGPPVPHRNSSTKKQGY